MWKATKEISGGDEGTVSSLLEPPPDAPQRRSRQRELEKGLKSSSRTRTSPFSSLSFFKVIVALGSLFSGFSFNKFLASSQLLRCIFIWSWLKPRQDFLLMS